MKPRASVTVSVPATTSNLGPAFDCLGLALDLRNELTLELHAEPGEPVVELEGEGAGSLPRGRENLVFRAANAVLAGRAEGRLVLRCLNRIPLARGLGSSAAAAVAGAVAGNRLLGKPALDDDQLLDYVATLEGHPDNAAPALRGGLVACVRDGQGVRPFALEPHRDLRAVVCIPDFELQTEKARAVLPPTYLREDAVFNVSRATLLGSALERGLWDRLPLAMEDRLHQPYRAPLIKGLSAVLRAARASGTCGAALSGSGPTVLALGPVFADLQGVGRAMQAAFAEHKIASRFLVLPIAREGARLS